MKQKILIVLGLITLTIIESCCDMRDGKPFFKISNMTVSQQYPNFDTYDFYLIFYGADFYSNRGIQFPSLISQAVACEGGEPDGFKGAKETIDSITIVTLNDFNATHKANSTINDEVFVLKSNSSPDNSKHWYDTLTVDNFIQSRNVLKLNSSSAYFKLESRPVDSFKIEVRLKLSNGKEIKSKNIPIKFD